MFSDHAILLALSDGARTAEEHGDRALAKTLAAMTRSLVESQRHTEDFRPWRQDDLQAIYEAAQQ